MSHASRTASIWTKLDASVSSDTLLSSHSVSSSPAPRSGHAMTFLPPTRSVLLFGGADGKIFFEDIYLLEFTQYGGSYDPSGREMRCRSGSRSADEADDVQWKRLVVSRDTTFTSQLSCSPLCPSPICNDTNSRGTKLGVERRSSTLLHSGGGRDYHTMHYVLSSADDEKTQGMRVLVIGNVVVATEEGEAQCGRGTQAQGSAANAAMAFDTLTLRVEELRVRQSLLEAQWEVRCVDIASMWKPRARHAHSSVVVGGEQVFVFGGKDATSSTWFNDIFYYDSSLNQWVKPTLRPTGQLPQPRAFAGLTASDDGNTLFLFGGTDGKQEFGSLFLYDIVHSRWDSLAGATRGDRPSCRINHSLTFVTPCHLVLFGGRRRAVRENELYIYNVSTRAWRLVSGGQSENGRNSYQQSSQTFLKDEAPAGRTAHATVLFRTDPAGPNAAQKLLVFGGYAGSHKWLDDLYLLCLSQSVLMHPPSSSITVSRSATHAWPTCEAAARMALPAPQQPLQTRQSSQRIHLQEMSTQPADILQKSAPPIEEPSQSSYCLQKQQQQLISEPVDSENCYNTEQSQSVLQSSTALMTPVSCSPRKALLSEPLRPDTAKRATAITATSGVLSDITNHTGFIAQQRQQQVAPRISGVSNATDNDTLHSAIKKHKRRRLGEDSRDCNGSGERTTVQVGIHTTLLQLMQHQPRMEDTLARILSMLTREQTAREQQRMTQETLMRAYSEEHTKCLEATSQRIGALEERLARSEAERTLLHEKLMARETELCMYKHSSEAAISPLSERAQAIESSHMQQSTMSRVIALKISAIHDFLDALRIAEGEGKEDDDSIQSHLGHLDDSVTTQAKFSPPKPLLYPQHVVLALKEKIRAMQLEKEALKTQLQLMAEKLKRFEGREAQARQFLFSWCQGDNLSPAAVAAMPLNATATVPVSAEPSVTTAKDSIPNTADS
ncbi:unnamed protein product [Peronospora effusa]|nr:unnamed protein product [Peronospora effusa]